MNEENLIVIISVLIILFFIYLLLFKKRKKRKLLEKDYQEYFCKKFKGKIEHGLEDNEGRVDCILKEYAVEVKRLSNSGYWGCIGQSLYYGIKTDKKPAILAIIEEDLDYKRLEKIKIVSKNHNIKLWTIDTKLTIKTIL